MPESKLVPKLADLHHDLEQAKKGDALNELLCQPPFKPWILKHPFAKGVRYIPIAKIEFLLTRIFQNWRVEVIDYKQLFNSVSVHVRLHYQSPITGVWSYHDGVGAMPIQTEKDADASDLSKIKSNAVMLALPAAESYAVKDAAEKLGQLFGKDLNREHTIDFKGAYSDDTPVTPTVELITNEQLKTLHDMLGTNTELTKLILTAFEIDGLDLLPADKWSECKEWIKKWRAKHATPNN